MQSFFSYNPTSSSSSSSPSPSPYYITNRDIISPEIPRGTGRITPPAHVSPSPAGGVRQLPTSSPILTAIRSYTFSPITGGGLVSSTPSGDRIIPLDPVDEPNPRGRGMERRGSNDRISSEVSGSRSSSPESRQLSTTHARGPSPQAEGSDSQRTQQVVVTRHRREDSYGERHVDKRPKK